MLTPPLEDDSPVADRHSDFRLPINGDAQLSQILFGLVRVSVKFASTASLRGALTGPNWASLDRRCSSLQADRPCAVCRSSQMTSPHRLGGPDVRW